MTSELSVDLPSKPSFPTTVTILRYGTTSLKTTGTVWHSKARIAKLLQVDYEDVCDVLAPHEGARLQPTEAATEAAKEHPHHRAGAVAGPAGHLG